MHKANCVAPPKNEKKEVELTRKEKDSLILNADLFVVLVRYVYLTNLTKLEDIQMLVRSLFMFVCVQAFATIFQMRKQKYVQSTTTPKIPFFSFADQISLKM